MAVNEFAVAAADLRQIPKEVRKLLTPALKRAAAPVVAEAKRRASWSSRIPQAISAKVLYGRRTPGVHIRVSAAKAPHARPHENLGKPGAFRHPLFGDRQVWFSQQARPFLFAAGRAHADVVPAEIDRIVDVAARLHGFR